MTKKWIAVDLILLIVAGLLGWRLKVSVDRFNAENNLARLQPVQDVKQKLTLEGGLPPLKPLHQYTAAEFAIIPDKNVFSDTRAREEKEAVAAVPETPPLQPKPVLVGVAISGGQRMASIIDPSVQGSGRKTQTKRLGDVYQGYTITDISETEMVLESGTRREVIPLHDGAKRQAQPGKTPILATRVVNFGGGGSGPVGAPPALAATVTRPVGQTGPAASSIGGPQRQAAGQQAAARPAAAPATVQQPMGLVNPSETTDAQGRRVIRTPFGDIVRDK